MRLQPDTRLICKQVQTLFVSLPKSRRRFYYFDHLREQASQPFIASPFLIDLDAADSKVVRPYEKQRDASYAPTTLHEKELRRDGTKRLTRPRSQQTRAIQPVIERIFEQSPITAADVLVYILVGDTPKKSNSSNATIDLCSTLENKFARQLPQIWKSERLLHEFSKNQSIILHETINSPEKALDGLKGRLVACTTFESLVHVIELVSSSAGGCNLLAASGKHIEHALNPFNKDVMQDQPRATTVLRFLNKFSLKMQSMDFEIGMELCNSSIYYSLKASNLPAAKRYLKLAIDQQYSTDKYTKAAIQILQNYSSTNDSFQLNQKGSLRTPYRVSSALELLTGFKEETYTRVEHRQPSLAAQISQTIDDVARSETYQSYLAAVRKLKSQEALSDDLSQQHKD